MLRIVLVLVLSFFGLSRAQYCALINSSLHAQDGSLTFLGLISFNAYDQYSIMDKTGKYGSESQPLSIFNASGKYGGESAAWSPFNPLSSKPPLALTIAANGDVFLHAVISKNKSAPMPPDGFTDSVPVIDPDSLVGFLASGTCSPARITDAATRKAVRASRGNADLLGRRLQNPRSIPWFAVPRR